MSKTIVVANPQSQGGTLGRRWTEILTKLRRHLNFEPVLTDAPGAATQITAKALDEGYERIIAIGGDGTINEVVNGFFSAKGKLLAPEAALGVIPFGTGGDLRRTFSLPTSIESAAEVIARDQRVAIDIGRIDFVSTDGAPLRRHFANVASFGISGVVSRYVNQSSKRFGGRLSFMLATARASFDYSNKPVRLTFDNDPQSSTNLTINTIAIANGRYFGGGMKIAPEASPQDGLFDIVSIGDLSWKEMLLSGHRIYHGTHLALDKVSHRRAHTVLAESDAGHAVELDIDGETPGVLPATFSVVPSAINFVR